MSEFEDYVRQELCSIKKRLNKIEDVSMPKLSIPEIYILSYSLSDDQNYLPETVMVCENYDEVNKKRYKGLYVTCRCDSYSYTKNIIYGIPYELFNELVVGQEYRTRGLKAPGDTSVYDVMLELRAVKKRLVSRGFGNYDSKGIFSY